MNELAGRRGAAYARDCIRYATMAAATVPLGLYANAKGWGRRRGFVLAVSAVPPVAATVYAGCMEARSGTTVGKRVSGLRVTDQRGEAPSLGRALLRNVVKIGVPWQIGHTLAIGAAFDGFNQKDPLTLAAAAVSYPLIGATAISVMTGTGRSIHDRVAGTVVISRR